jgi:hypothetical protein
MGKLKTVTLWSLLAFIVLTNVLKYNYFKHVFTGDLFFGGNIRSVLNISGAVFVLLLDSLYLVLGIMAVATADKAARDRAYSLLRFVFVMQSLIYFPLMVIEMITYAKYTFANPASAFSLLFFRAIWITLVILLINCKPEKQVQKVDLQEYDMVAFTSAGHRFVHYLFDWLFLLPIWSFALQYMTFETYGAEAMQLAVQLVFATSYLLYCFLSEAIFKQTMGKIVTRSCVVSDGVELSTGRVFRRTMARLIPFDAFSFLFGAKWHDRASHTAVVYVDSWEKAFDEPKQ